MVSCYGLSRLSSSIITTTGLGEVIVKTLYYVQYWEYDIETVAEVIWGLATGHVV